MQISKSEEKYSCPPPPKSWLRPCYALTRGAESIASLSHFGGLLVAKLGDLDACFFDNFLNTKNNYFLYKIV